MKKFFCLAAVLLVALTFSACKGEEAEKNESSSRIPAASDAANSSSDIVFPPKNYSNTESVNFDGKHFAAGIWETRFEGELTGIYRFDESGTDCEYYLMQEEASIPFDYIAGENGSYIFHLGTPDFDTGATVSFADSTHATLTWETTEIEQLTYVGNMTVEEYLNNR